MYFTIEKLNNVPSWVAVKRGPVVLGAKISSNPVAGFIAGAGRFDHSPGGTLPDPNSAPRLAITGSTFQSQFRPVAGRPFTYKAPGIFQNKSDTSLVFEPFSGIHDSRYMMYWNATVDGEIVTVNKKVRPIDMEFYQILSSKGVLSFSFNNEDASRRIFLFSLCGRKVAEIPAAAPKVTFNCGSRACGISDGTYVLQVTSGTRQQSKKMLKYGSDDANRK
jgi:hypothetical protein